MSMTLLRHTLQRPARAATCVLLTLGLLVGGCGGDDGLSAGALRKRADAICTTHANAVDKALDPILSAGGGGPGDARFASAITDDVVPQYRDQLTELRKLEPSETTAAAWKAWLKALDAQVEALAAPAGPGAPNAGPPAINRANWRDANGKAKALRLSTACQGGIGSAS